MFELLPDYNQIGNAYAWDQLQYEDFPSQYRNLQEKIDSAKTVVQNSMKAARDLHPRLNSMAGQEFTITQIYQLIAQDRDNKNKTSVPYAVQNASPLEKYMANSVVEQVQRDSGVEKIEAVKATLFFGMIPIHQAIGSLVTKDQELPPPQPQQTLKEQMEAGLAKLREQKKAYENKENLDEPSKGFLAQVNAMIAQVEHQLQQMS